MFIMMVTISNQLKFSYIINIYNKINIHSYLNFLILTLVSFYSHSFLTFLRSIRGSFNLILSKSSSHSSLYACKNLYSFSIYIFFFSSFFTIFYESIPCFFKFSSQFFNFFSLLFNFKVRYVKKIIKVIAIGGMKKIKYDQQA